MIKASMNGPRRISKGHVTAEEKRNHWKRARTYRKVAARRDQHALSQDASRRSREARLFFVVSKLVKVVLACKF